MAKVSLITGLWQIRASGGVKLNPPTRSVSAATTLTNRDQVVRFTGTLDLTQALFPITVHDHGCEIVLINDKTSGYISVIPDGTQILSSNTVIVPGQWVTYKAFWVNASTSFWKSTSAIEPMVYGSLHANAVSSAVSGYVNGSITNVMGAFGANGPSNLVTPDHSANTLTLSVPGTYRVYFDVEISPMDATSANKIFSFQLYKASGTSGTGLVTGFLRRIMTKGESQPEMLSMEGVITVAPGEVSVYEMRYDAGGATSVQMYNAVFGVERLGNA